MRRTVINKESFSALVDNEVTEIEAHRLVREFKSDQKYFESWLIYQQIRTVLRAEDGNLEIDNQRLLFERITQAVRLEDEHHIKGERPARAIPLLAGSLSVAACLLVAVFLGIQQPEPDDARNFAETVTEQAEVLADVNDSQSAEMVELDEEKKRRLRVYLNQHDRMSRMNSKQRLVNYRESTEN